MARSVFGKQFDETVHWLRKSFPPKNNNAVRIKAQREIRVDGCRCNGLATSFKDHWEIKLDRGLKGGALIDTLIHEWSHTQQADFDKTCHCFIRSHSSSWGRHYARLYRAYLRWEGTWE